MLLNSWGDSSSFKIWSFLTTKHKRCFPNFIWGSMPHQQKVPPTPSCCLWKMERTPDPRCCRMSSCEDLVYGPLCQVSTLPLGCWPTSNSRYFVQAMIPNSIKTPSWHFSITPTPPSLLCSVRGSEFEIHTRPKTLSNTVYLHKHFWSDFTVFIRSLVLHDTKKLRKHQSTPFYKPF